MNKDFKAAIDKYLDDNGYNRFQPKVALFDMDGVLLDSMPNHAVAWQVSMKKFGLDMTAEDAYATEGMKGVDTIRIMVKNQKNEDISEETAQAMYDEKAREFAKMPRAKVMPGVKMLMKKMRDEGIEIGIVTGSAQRPLIKRVAREFCRYVEADKIVTAYDVKHGKPSPMPYKTGLAKFGKLKPWNAIVVENAPLGVRAGVAANFFTIAVNTGPLPDEALSGEGANIVFKTMAEVCEAWDEFFNPHKTIDESWNDNCQAIIDYMKANKRRPSKHRVEDHKMLNWIKYNKKMIKRGKMSADRLERFEELLALAQKYKRLNKQTYLNTEEVALEFPND